MTAQPCFLWSTSKSSTYILHLFLAQTPWPAWLLSVIQTSKSFLLKPLNPMLHCSLGITKKLGYFGTFLPLRNH
jgi:hypothetical protein